MSTKKSPPFAKEYPIGTKRYYPNGARHMAWDVMTPMGTWLLAPRDGVILDCQDGFPSNSLGQNYTGEPSNWILLGYLNAKGQKRSMLFQHLSAGLKVKKGQKVMAGERMARTGNSGNSTGPHCHIAAMKGHATRKTRYEYMYDMDILIYPPSLCWAESSL